MRADVLVGSAVLHGAAVALFVHWLPAKEAPPAPRSIDVTVAPAPEPAAEPAMDVTIVELSPTLPPPRVPELAPPAPASRPPASHEVASRELSASHEPPGREPPAGATDRDDEPAGATGHAHEPAAGPGLHMRGPDLALAPDTAQRIAAGGAPLHERAHESGKLEDVSGGGAVIHDRVTTVTVERDGTAHFADKPDIDAHFHSPIPHLDFKADMHALGDALEDWYRDPYAGTRYGPSTDLSEVNRAVPGMCDQWGDPGCDDPLAPEVEKRARSRWNVGGVGVHGSADLTAYLYRKLVHADPYASRKLRLLDDTRAERVERGEAFRAEQAARSAELMQRTLEQLWASTRDPVARREALHELWSDCADDAAGARARAMVIGWIRAKLPAGSPDAYTAAELARWSFSPYANDEASRLTPNAIAPVGTR